MIVDLLSTVLVLGFGWALLAPTAQALPPREGRLVVASFALHALSTVAIGVISTVVYEGVFDAVGFQRAGELIASAMRQDPWEVVPRAVALFFHQDTMINVPLNFEARGGKSTISMWIVAAFGDLVLNSFHATATACALFSFAGKLAGYRTLRRYFDPNVRPWVAGAMLLVPSVIYWTSGLIKEAIAVGGLGFALAGLHAVFVDRRPGGAVSLIGGAVLVGLIKPYLLVPFAAAVGALLYVRASGGRSLLQVRPLYLVLGAVIAALAVVAVGRISPVFALENLGDSAAKMQFYGQRAAGGSFYLLGDPTESSALGQLRFAPIALFTALYRPTVFDIVNPMILVNAIETTALLGLTVYVAVISGWRWALRTVLTNPALAFGVAFALPLALGVGLVSNNFGTLSRYRSPLVPYQVMVLSVLGVTTREQRRRKPSVSVRRPPMPIPRLPRLPPPHARPPRRTDSVGSDDSQPRTRIG